MKIKAMDVSGWTSTYKDEPIHLTEGVIFYFFNVYLFLTEGERERQTEHESGRGRQRGRHRIRSRLQAPSCQHRARQGARTHKLRDHDLSQSWLLSPLGYPGAPHFLKIPFLVDAEVFNPSGSLTRTFRWKCAHLFPSHPWRAVEQGPLLQGLEPS